MKDQLPFELKQPKFDPRHIGMAEKKVYYLVLRGNPGRDWMFLYDSNQLFAFILELDSSPYKQRVQIFRVSKPGKSTSSYAMVKIFDSLFDFLDEKFIPRYKNYLDSLDPQKNLIVKLLKNV